jgi:hypothetical protein
MFAILVGCINVAVNLEVREAARRARYSANRSGGIMRQLPPDDPRANALAIH